MANSNVNKPLLSVAMITFNEERVIEKTLSAIHNWVDEIVVVDSLSTDKTIDILECFNVSLYKEKWQGYSKQKNLAISKCNGNWILVLDADEVVNDALRKEILENLKKPAENIGFKIKRKFYLGKRWVRYGGYYPDYQLRLFKSSSGAHFKPREVHESISLDGNIGELQNPLEHYAYPNLKAYSKALDKYAVLASIEIKNKKYKLPFLRALWAFIFRYIFRLGFLEGSLGFNMAKAYSGYVYKKYKIAENTNPGRGNS